MSRALTAFRRRLAMFRRSTRIVGAAGDRQLTT
jgi:hypothetical protein